MVMFRFIFLFLFYYLVLRIICYTNVKNFLFNENAKVAVLQSIRKYLLAMMHDSLNAVENVDNNDAQTCLLTR